MDEVKKFLTACVMSRKGGVPIQELNADYAELVGEPIPIKRLGFESLEQLLRCVPGLTLAKGVLTAAASANTRHLHELIRKQKDPAKKQKKIKNRYQPYHQFDNQKHDYQPSAHQKSYPKPHYQYQPQHHYPRQPFQPKYEPYPRTNYPTRQRYPYSKCPPKAYYDCPMDLRDVITARRETSDNNNCWDFDLNVRETLEFQMNGNFFESFEEDIDCCDEKENYIHDCQIIGDDHMLNLTQRKRSRLCASGMTIKKATLAVRQYGCAQDVLIAIGTVDILKGLAGEEMALDMQQLIQTLRNMGCHVALCTVPPLPNINGQRATIDAVNVYNRWVKSGLHGAPVVDLATRFKKGPYLKLELFERYARFVPGCQFAIHHWNYNGREVARHELRRCLAS